MEKSQIAASIKNLNQITLDETQSNLHHITSLQHTINNSIAQIALQENKSFDIVKSEVEALIV